MKSSLTLKFASLVVVAIVVAASGCGSLGRVARAVKSSSPNPPQKERPAEELDPQSPQDQIKRQTQDLLAAADFGALERMTDAARTNKERLKGGYWKLDAIYDGLSNIYADNSVQPVTEDAWENRIKILTEWTSASPRSPTPKVALAAAYINYGWFARGHGYADTVSASDSKLLVERLDRAGQVLMDARKEGLVCPRWYREALFLGMAENWPMEEIEQVYEEFLTIEPNYLQAHLVMSELLTPKWGGKHGEWRKFVDSIPTTLSASQSDEGDLIYFVVVANKLREPSLQINWGNFAKDRVRNGFKQLEDRYGVDTFRLNQFVRTSCQTGDLPSANATFKRIGANRDPDVWDQPTFDMMKAMADPSTLPAKGTVIHRDLKE